MARKWYQLQQCLVLHVRRSVSLPVNHLPVCICHSNLWGRTHFPWYETVPDPDVVVLPCQSQQHSSQSRPCSHTLTLARMDPGVLIYRMMPSIVWWTAFSRKWVFLSCVVHHGMVITARRPAVSATAASLLRQHNVGIIFRLIFGDGQTFGESASLQHTLSIMSRCTSEIAGILLIALTTLGRIHPRGCFERKLFLVSILG